MQSSTMGKPAHAGTQTPGKLKATPSQRRPSVSSPSNAKSGGLNPTDSDARSLIPSAPFDDAQCPATAIERCVQSELRRYFDMLDGEEPANLYRMVVRQAEHAVINMVMDECRGNQTRASEWLGISRGNLRTKLASMDK